MTPLRKSLNFAVHSRAPAVVKLVRRLRTAHYRRRAAPHFQARFLAHVDEWASQMLQGSDEKRPVMSGPRQRHLTSSPVVEINNTCNIDCVMCKTSLATRKKGKISNELLKLVLDRFTSMDITGVELHTIGDPLANPNLPQVFSELRRNHLTTAITTNGLLLHRHWRTILDYRDVCRGLTMSIDGATKETYERIRFGGKWEALLENVDIARRELKGNIPLRLNMVISKDNIAEFGDYIVMFRDVVEEPSRDINFSLLNSLTPDGTYFKAMNLFPLHTRKNLGCKFVTGESLFAHIDGRASVCCRDYDGSLVVGDLKTQTVPQIWESPRLAEMQAAHDAGDVTSFALCDTCFVVDTGVQTAFSLFTHMLVHEYPRANAEFYQGAINECIAALSVRPTDRRRIHDLVRRLNTGSSVAA